MIRLKIKRIDKYNSYILEKPNGSTVSLILEIILGFNLQINDEICLSKTLLDFSSPSFVQPYAFTKCSKEEYENLLELEKAQVISNNNVIFLKRIYG